MKIISVSEASECKNGRMFRTVRCESKPFPMAVREYADSEDDFPARKPGDEVSLETQPYIKADGTVAMSIVLA